MKKRKINFLVKPVLSGLVILLALAFILGYILKVLTTSDYFRVNDVIGEQMPGVDFSRIKGENIFTLDLYSEAENIARFCPDCLRVRLARVLPDRIFVEFVRRKPVALVKLYRNFAVDQYGVFFDSSSANGDFDLPVITGLDGKIFGAKPGLRCKVKELLLVLSIIKEANNTRLLRDYRLQEIKVNGLDDITISIAFKPDAEVSLPWRAREKQRTIEVRISQGGIHQKVIVMAGLLNQEQNNPGNIKYIDLRFREPVIKFKDAK